MSDSEEEIAEKQLKIAFLGDSGVGKTSIIRRFCQDDFTKQSTPTIGADFYTKHVLLPDHQDVTLIISDIGGQELSGSMLDKYLFNINILIFIYDITTASSFDSLSLWMETVSAFITKPALTAVLGNKCDLEHQRAIRTDKTEQFVAQYNMQNFTVSARTGEFLSASMMELVAKYLGVRLSKVQKDQQPVVKARLVPPTALGNRIKSKQKHVRKQPTTVCTIQFIEKYTENIRFCIICNYLSKIIPALQSRCTRFRFAPLVPSQILPRLNYVIEQEKLAVSEDGKQALLTLSNGDMRKVLNVLQSTWLAFKNVTEDNVYTCVGHPLKSDIENVTKWLLNETFKTTYNNIKQLQNLKGLALPDILTEVHRYVHRIEFPQSTLIVLLDKMATIEHRLSVGADESIQLTALVASFQHVKELSVPN